MRKEKREKRKEKREKVINQEVSILRYNLL